MVILAFESAEEDGHVVVRNSDGSVSVDDLFDIFDLLLDEKENCISHWAWDLDVFCAPILRLMGLELAAEIWRTHKAKFYLEDNEGNKVLYDMFYMPGKVMKIEKQQRTIHLNAKGVEETHFPEVAVYHLSQFFPDDFESQSLSDVVAHATVFHEKLIEMGLAATTKYTSPIGIFRDIYMKPHTTKSGWKTKGLDVPSIDNIPEQALVWAAECTGRFWIEAHRLGHVKNCVDYDIRRAFSSVAARLQDTRECTWIHSKTIPKGAVFGVANGTLTIYDKVTVSPFLYSKEGEVHKSPTGTWPEKLLLQDIVFLKMYKLGEYSIEDGYWGVPKRVKYPLAVVMDRVNKWRGSDRFTDLFGKRVANGIVGLMGEEWADSFGAMWNPIFKSTVESITRNMVADFVYRHKLMDSLVTVSLDGLLATKDVELSEDDAEDWRKTTYPDALIVSSGLVFLGERKPHGLHKDELLAMMKEHPDTHVYGKPLKRIVTLGEAINKGDLSELGMMKDHIASVDLAKDHDRVFSPCPRTGRDFTRKKKPYTSRPFKIRDGELVA